MEAELQELEDCVQEKIAQLEKTRVEMETTSSDLRKSALMELQSATTALVNKGMELDKTNLELVATTMKMQKITSKSKEILFEYPKVTELLLSHITNAEPLERDMELQETKARITKLTHELNEITTESPETT